LAKNPKDRLGVNGLGELKSHPWFESIDWDGLESKQVDAPYKIKSNLVTDTFFFDENVTKKSVNTDFLSVLHH
jgi:hypothetical protein